MNNLRAALLIVVGADATLIQFTAGSIVTEAMWRPIALSLSTAAIIGLTVLRFKKTAA